LETVKSIKSKARNRSPKRDRRMSLERFLEWQPKDGYVYEWANGIIIPKKAMQNHERMMVSKILRKFQTTQTFQKGDELLPETDCQLSATQVRRPDIAYFTKDQLLASARGEHPIPSFVVEIISKNDKMDEVEEKRLEYFKAGVQVAWYIFPKIGLVRVFTSAKQSIDCMTSDICSADPAIPDLSLKADEIFEIL
jgi:Uma2 family endonuclease